MRKVHEAVALGPALVLGLLVWAAILTPIALWAGWFR